MGIDLWWAGLDGLGKVYGGLAVLATLIFLLQTLVTLFSGGDHDHGHDSGHSQDFETELDHDLHGSGHAKTMSISNYFTIKNIIAFFLGLSWGGLWVLDSTSSGSLSILIGSGIGTAMVFVNLGILRGLSLLQNDGSIRIENAVGHTGQVIISVPGKLQGYGKISVLVQGTNIELNAVTDGKLIKSGKSVKIVRIDGHQAVVI